MPPEPQNERMAIFKEQLRDQGQWSASTRGRNAARVLALCRELSGNLAGGRFSLSVTEVCHFLSEADRLSAWRSLKILELEGHIRLLQKGTSAMRSIWELVRPVCRGQASGCDCTNCGFGAVIFE